MAKKHHIYKSAHRWRSTYDARKLEAPPQVHLDVEHIGIISDEMREVVQANGPSWPTSCRRRSRKPELKKAPDVPGLPVTQ
jgi:hypothetical protein